MSFLPACLPARVMGRLAACLAATAVVLVGLAPLSLAPANAERWRIPPSSTDVAPRASLAEFEIQVMNRINEVRRSAGLRKIARFDSCVDRMAEGWAGRIAKTGVLAHRDQRQVLRRCGQSWAGENLVRGRRLTPHGAVDAWMASPGHREIILTPRARLAGVAFQRDGRGWYVGVLNVTDPK
jgi:uncharacterized protein YkwD